MDTKVTVVVPLYNKAAFVKRALQSIRAQTFDDFEVVIIDDGSTDDSAAIAGAFRDRRFQLIQQPNQGPGAARNRGISMARGELLAFLDADDEWLPDYLEAAVSRLSGSLEIAVACSYLEDPGGKSSEPLWRARGLLDGSFQAAASMEPERFVHAVAFFSPCTTVIRTEAMRRWGGFFDENRCVYGEDAFLWLKVLLNETVGIDLAPRVRLHREAAGLSKNLRGPRPIEPFLEYPEKIRCQCPAHLQPLLNSFLTIRAFKTTCVWGLWGRWRAARELRKQFRSPRDFHLPYYWPSMLCSTPLATILGSLLGKQRF